MCRVTRVTASRNSRSWLITTSVPAKRCSQPSSQTSASRSRWLVGSSSSSRSAGHMSARASASRMRQPPEKLLHRRVELRRLEAEAEQQCFGAGARVESAGMLERQMRIGHRVAIVCAFSAVQCGLRFAQRRVAVEHEVGRRAVGLRHGLHHFGDTPIRRHRGIAGVGLQPAGEQREQRRLARAVAADEADVFARIERHAGCVENHPRTTSQGQRFQDDHLRCSTAFGGSRDA